MVRTPNLAKPASTVNMSCTQDVDNVLSMAYKSLLNSERQQTLANLQLVIKKYDSTDLKYLNTLG